MTEKAANRRKAIKIANEIDLKDSQIVIVTGDTSSICKSTFVETVKNRSSVETTVDFPSNLNNAIK